MYRRRIYIITLIVLFAALLYAKLSARQETEVRYGYAAPLIPSAWQALQMKSAEEVVPVLSVDGEEIIFTEDLPYLSAGKDIMIPVSVLKESMKASYSVNGELLTVIRGERTLKIDLQTDKVTIQGETAVIAGAGIRRNGVVYVSAEILSKALEFQYSFDRSSLRAEITLPLGNYLPAVFSLEELSKMPEVMDQGELGSCWAFAALSALESTLLPEENLSFSRDHMLLKNSFEFSNSGGDSGMAMAYLLSWQGPVVDPSDVYGDGVTNELLSAVKHVQSVDVLNDPSIEEIKEKVFFQGGVTSSMYLVMADDGNLFNISTYYNEYTCSYCYTGEKDVNHDVVIVGWDDSYSRLHFMNSEMLGRDGAFLCMNSWGTDFGNRGFFWVSYEDTRFLQSAMSFSGVGDMNDYDRIYQTDLCGATANAGYDDDTVWFANVYTAETDELLTAVGFYTMGENSSYEVMGVSEFVDAKSLLSRSELSSGLIREAGFHTVELKKPMALSKGQKFAVIVRLTTPGAAYPAAIEKPTDGVPEVDISDGESYISSHGSYFRRAEEESGGNVCLKAYTLKR